MHTLNLENVNYIPSNKYNIFALGRWDNNGRKYQASGSELLLIDRQGIPVLKGPKIASNIYKFHLKLHAITNKTKMYMLSCEESKQSWETWHHRFGHVSYKGLKCLNNDKLVDGFTVNENTLMPACESCTQAKQTVKEFPKKTEHTKRQKGKLTHIDLWGKYDVASINGKQYYLLLVDNATRYVIVFFLKAKHEASQFVKNYLTYLHVRGTTTYGICVDRGTKFINKDLQNWCHEKGMDVQLTVPYSPSQNGVAERMNRTLRLIKLSRAMIVATKMLEFLWEHAVSHAAYVHNRSYTISIRGQTPYEAWHGIKPNIAHLREFGVPVWVLLQGQNIAQKILSK